MANTDQPANFPGFLRYYRGEMSEQEQHAFEKKLLADPAFSDAYDGFLLMQETNLDLQKISADLSRSLHERIDKKTNKRFAFPVYAAAAALILVVGIAWLVVFKDANKKAMQEASSELPAVKTSPNAQVAAKPEIQPESAALPPEKSIKTLPRTAFSAQHRNAAPAVAPAQEPVTSDLPDTDIIEEHIAAAEPVPSAFPAVPQPLSNLRQQVSGARPASTNSTRLVSGRLLDEKGRGLPGATVSAFGSGAVVTDSVGKFKITARTGDSLRLVSVGYDHKTVNVEDTSFGNIPMKQETAALENAVIVGYAATKKASVSLAKPQPEGGWQQYQAYLDKNSIPFKDSTTVYVEFLVKPDGTLSDFKVTGPAEIRDRAIQIIRQGPSWKPGSNQGSPAGLPVRVSLRIRSAE